MQPLAIFLDETNWKNTREILEETQENFLQVFLEESVEVHLKDSPKEHLIGFFFWYSEESVEEQEYWRNPTRNI